MCHDFLTVIQSSTSRLGLLQEAMTVNRLSLQETRTFPTILFSLGGEWGKEDHLQENKNCREKGFLGT